MDINTRLDGFIVHPLDAFNDHHHEDDIPKFSSTAPHLDGFQVHPLDSFISHEHNNDISNDYLNFSDTNQINTNYLPTDTFTTDNLLFNNNTIDLTIYQPEQISDLISTTNYNNNDYNYNQYETTNYTTSQYPITYTEPTTITTPITTTTTTTNYNYISSPSYNTYTTSSQNNYINTSTTYENYPSTSSYNFSKILPPKYLPAIKSQSTIKATSAPTIKLVPKITKKVTYATSSVIVPKKIVYTVPSYSSYTVRSYSPVINTTNFTSQILPASTSSYKFNSTAASTYKPTVLVKRPYSVVTYEPQIKWNNIIPQKKTIIIPKVKRYIVPRRTSVIVPQKQSIIIPNSVIPQPQQSISVVPSIIQPSPSQIISTPVTPNVIVPTITLGNPIQVHRKFPSDNLAPRSTIISNNPIGLNKIYYPRDFDKKSKKK